LVGVVLEVDHFDELNVKDEIQDQPEPIIEPSTYPVHIHTPSQLTKMLLSLFVIIVIGDNNDLGLAIPSHLLLHSPTAAKASTRRT
jgi:hypothetical protein